MQLDRSFWLRLPRWIWWLVLAGNAASVAIFAVSTSVHVPVIGTSAPGEAAVMIAGAVPIILLAIVMLILSRAR